MCLWASDDVPLVVAGERYFPIPESCTMPLIGLYVVQATRPAFLVLVSAHIVRSTAIIYDRYNALRLEPKRLLVAGIN